MLASQLDDLVILQTSLVSPFSFHLLQDRTLPARKYCWTAEQGF